MNVKIVLASFLSLLLTINFFMPVQALEKNDFFIYDITDAGHSLSVGEQLIVNEGFGSQSYPIGTKVNATFLYIAAGGIKFQYWVGDYYWVGFFGLGWLDFFGVLYSTISLYMTYEMIEDYHNGYLANLVLYHIHPYLNPTFSTYLSSPETFAEEISSLFTKGWYPNIECLCNYTTIDNIFYFESWIGGEVDGNFGAVINEKDNYPTDISFGNSFHVVVNKTSCLVYGCGFRGWVKGTINNLAVDVSLACEYELEGYDLPAYQFGSNNNHLLKRNLVIILSTVIPGTVLIATSSYFIFRYLHKKRDRLT